MLSALAGLTLSPPLTIKIPRIEATIPIADRISGKRAASNSENGALTAATVASVIAEMIEPTYDSNRSDPIPATSPTLSPTLSAITAGLRGSSSGMPASTLPTRSAPTSAAFV